jgi:hypothetical protein
VELGVPLVAVVIVMVGCPSTTDLTGEPQLSWHVETLDPDGGRYTSIALYRSGYPHNSYFDYTNYKNDLKYARYGKRGQVLD